MSPDAPFLSDPSRHAGVPGGGPGNGTGGSSVDPRIVAEAARVLDAGGLAIFPTETLHAAAVRADRPHSIERLGTLIAPTAPDRPLGATLHLAGLETLDKIGTAAHGPEGFGPGHRRLIERLLPGAVRLLIELDECQMARVRTALALVPGAAEVDGMLSVRVPSHAGAGAVLAAARGPVVAVAAGALGGRSDADLAAALQGVGGFVRVALGPEPRGMRSTTVVLTAGGGVRVSDEGAMPSREITRAMERRVLFVCTGNTCRSPMAEAIARRIVEGQGPSPIRTLVSSAGTGSGSGGSGATGEAIEVMRRRGLDISGHVSRALTREMVEWADEIYAMTARHARAIEAIGPAGAARVRLLDPEGQDVEDPIGAPASEYERVASLLERMIGVRLAQADRSGSPAGPGA